MSHSTPAMVAAALLAFTAAGCASRSPGNGAPASSSGSAATLPAPMAASALRARLFTLAHDSMGGRAAGTVGNVKATDYIAAEMRRIGLEPAGENGSWFQTIPLVRRYLDPGSSIVVGDNALTLWTDYAPLRGIGSILPFGGQLTGTVPVIFGGRIGGSVVTPEQAAGKLVVFLPPRGANGAEDYRFWQNAWWPSGGLGRYASAAGIAVASFEISPAQIRNLARDTQTVLGAEGPAAARPLGMIVTLDAARRLTGLSMLETAAPGTAGRPVTAAIRLLQAASAQPARNVVGILRGSDPALRGQYVAISAHNDHDPPDAVAVDHDSVRAFNRVMSPEGANGGGGRPNAAQAARIRAILDSMRAIRPPRRDSIYNGADDDGSGTVALLAIAEAMAAGPRPRRSMLFISHTAEEMGLYGSEWYSDHPTVPRDSIVALFNMDMVGRGRAEDIAGGGEDYLQIIGSRRLSTQLGALVDSVNAARRAPMRIDYQFDAPGHPYNRYCRSDHFMYARHGVPITYVSRGYHIDYHQVSDEPQYIDYAGLGRVADFVREAAAAVANRPARLVVDGPRQDPNAPCRQ